jgi:hypothetical protein
MFEKSGKRVRKRENENGSRIFRNGFQGLEELFPMFGTTELLLRFLRVFSGKNEVAARLARHYVRADPLFGLQERGK